MNNIRIDISKISRECSAVPPVQVLAYQNEGPFIEQQLINSLQICFRLSASVERLTTNIDGIDYDISFPCLLIKRPGEIHKITSFGTLNSFFFSYIAGTNLPFLPDDLTICELMLNPELQTILHHILELMNHPNGFGVCDQIDLWCQHLLIEFLLTIKKKKDPFPEAENKMRQILSYLQVNYADHIDYELLAQKFGYSLRTFTRRWRQCYGDSPANYVAQLRFSEAKRLLT